MKLLLAVLVLAVATSSGAAAAPPLSSLSPHHQPGSIASRLANAVMGLCLKPPTFPSSFQTSYVFSLPYVRAVQSAGLSFPVDVWFDGPGSRLRVDVANGLDSTLTLQDTTYLTYPRVHKKVCDVIHDAAGPTVADVAGVAAGLGVEEKAEVARAAGRHVAALLGAAPLPDISGWSYGGSTEIGGRRVRVWTRLVKQGGKVSQYTFYTTPDGAPVRLVMLGFNIIASSHFDEYVFDFKQFAAADFSSSSSSSSDSSSSGGSGAAATAAVFEVPELCGDAQRRATLRASDSAEARAALAGAAAMLPSAAVSSVSSSSNDAQQLARLAARQEARAFVASWDAGKAGFKVALNRFADWPHERYQALATSHRRRSSDGSSRSSSSSSSKASLGVLEAPKGLTKKHLPKQVDWRGTGADNVVKDQATCGSCWAFSAVGAMQGAWNLATGETLSLSEQQLVDCSWKYGNNGCQGGEMEPAIEYVADHGGSFLEEDYPYAGVNQFCVTNATRPDAERPAKFKGFANVKKRDELALMYAVWKHGPVAVSIDASQPSFKFYAEGVYSDPKCYTDPDHMDHAVLLVGYGTDRLSGEDYWLIKNSWSKYWGDDGYIKMARTAGSGNDCGVTTDPVLAVVHPKYVTRPAAGLPRLTPPVAVTAAAAGKEEVQQQQQEKLAVV